MLNPHQLAVLDRLEHGAYFNVVHSTARELIEMGYAREDFGRLAITEAGRVALRQPTRRRYTIIDTHVADLGRERQPYTIDPMANPATIVNRPLSDDDIEALVTSADTAVTVLSPACDTRQRALRAAGVASGKTGNWVDAQWIDAFIEAFDDTAE